MSRLDNQTRKRVRELRLNATDAERKLWAALKSAEFFGRRFRRQYPVAPYIADIACVEVRLIIEVDGGQHAESASDVKRDAALKAAGWRVLRFWNSDVLTSIEGVIETIAAALDASHLDCPHPNPPPAEPREGFPI